MRRFAFSSTWVVVFALGTPLSAQEPSPEICKGVLVSAVSEQTMRGDLVACAPHLVGDAVQVLADSRSVDDPDRLARALRLVWHRHPDVFAAATALAEQRDATPRARALGLLTAYALIEPPYWPSHFESHRQLLVDVAPPRCLLAPSLGSPWTNTELPSTYLTQLLQLTTRLAEDPSEPEIVRTLARCAPHSLRALIFRVEHPDSLRTPGNDDPQDQR